MRWKEGRLMEDEIEKEKEGGKIERRKSIDD